MIGEALTDHPLAYAVLFFGALLPDIDEENSYIGRRFFFLSLPIRMIFGHRGFTHSLLALLLVSIGVYFLPIDEPYQVAFIIGFGSHILADFLTNSGVPLFYPLDKRFKFFFTFNTGGAIEYIFIFFLSLIIFGFSLYYQGSLLLLEAQITGVSSIKELIQNFGL
jgi:inner membrane protein